MTEIKLENTKQSFLSLCEQYANLGKLLSMMGSLVVDKRQSRIILAFNLQFQSMGEQLKHVGAGLDDMGGKSVMHGPAGRDPSAN